VDVKRTDRNAQAVKTNEVLAAVAAGDLLAVAALGGVVLSANLDLGVLLRSTLGSGKGNSGHGGDEERLEEGHFDWFGWCWFGGRGWVKKRVWCCWIGLIV
jgi:hypothetical protein